MYEGLTTSDGVHTRENVKKIFTEDTYSSSFHSECFSSNDFEEEEDETINCIDEASNLFSGLKRKEPTLEEALESMGYEKYRELAKNLLERSKDKLSEFELTGFTAEDIAVVYCYTFEWSYEEREKHGKGGDPYRILNNSLSVDRNRNTLRKTRYFLFLLLKALRKLPRFIPDNHTLYRGMRILVQTEPDPNFPKRQPYAAGNEKTWWTFTSTSLSLEATRSFIGNDGTLFTLIGETWGYDISIFSDFPDEKEILLEPERKLSITSVIRDDRVITINAEILDTPLVLRDIIEVGKPAKFKEKTSKNNHVPENFRAERVAGSTVELAWDAVNKVVSYKVSSRKAGGVFNKNLVSIERTKETRCTIRDLEPEEKYEFRAKCIFEDGTGRWCDKIVVKTEKPYTWKECPVEVEAPKKYSVDRSNRRVVTNIDYWRCVVPSITSLPKHETTKWEIKVLNSRDGDGDDIYIGVAPMDVSKEGEASSNNNNIGDEFYGWYLCCYDLTLCSGPPHNHRRKEYGALKVMKRKKGGDYVHTGNSVGVVIDTSEGKLSFSLNGEDLGVAYYGIPRDKPLIPCVILGHKDDSVELITEEQLCHTKLIR